MAAAIFRAKFTVPSASAHYRPRARLDRLWRLEGRGRLLTTTAGPGWGKTDFLAGRARALGKRAVWYTLDELDRDPTVLVAHLAAACGLEPSPSPPLEQLAAIVGRLDDRQLLVLDDVQAIGNATAARDLLAHLLRYLPRGCMLALASRERLDLAAARLETRGEATHLTAADLAFTLRETTAVVRERLGRPLAPSVAGRLHAVTEGWPAGLEIACQALGPAADAERLAILARLERGDLPWFDAFVREVMADLDDATRSFMLQTAVLPLLEPGLCDRLLGRRDSASRLGRLAASGLFTTALGGNGWRYHNLMRGCLLRQLEQETPPSRRRRLRRRAAAVLAAVGEPEAAALDLVHAGDTAGAADLITAHAARLVDSRRPETLSLVLAGLGDEHGEVDPRLRLVRAAHALLRGRWDSAEVDLRRALRAPVPPRLAGALQARLTHLHLQRGEFARCLAVGRRALATQPTPVGADRGLILTSLGVAAASLGRMEAGATYLGEALALARRRRDLDLEGRCLYLTAANIHYIRGSFDLALRDATLARDLYRDRGRLDLACHAEGVLGFVLAGCGRLAEARASSRWALQRAESIGYRLIEGYARLTLGECDLRAQEATAAAQRFAEAATIATELGEQALETWARLGLAAAAWARDDLAAAHAEADLAHALATRRGDRFCRARALAWRGRLDERHRAGAGQAAWAEADRLLRGLGAEHERASLRRWRQEACPAPGVTAAPRLPAQAAPEAMPPAASAPLHVRLLGPLAITRGPHDDLAVGAWRSRRARRLLNLLLLQRGRPVAREVVMEAMWPEAEPAQAALNLRQAVFQLRSRLEPPGAPSPRHVLAEGEALRLDLGEGGTCDLDRFEQALATARAAARSARQDTERRALQDAVALWRGRLLADTPYEAEADEAGGLVRHRYLRALERLLDLADACRDRDEQCLLARQGLAEDPLHEAFARHLLRGLLGLGRRQEARAEYTRFEARLVRELSVLPSSRLKELAEAAIAPPS